MTLDSITSGINSLSEGSLEDLNDNYRKAIQLYELGVAYLEEGVKRASVGDLSSHAVFQKCDQYKQRIKEIESYLAENPNCQRKLSIKRSEDYDMEKEGKQYYVEQAIVQATLGLEKDRKKLYLEAISYYEKAIELFLDGIKYNEIEGQLAKEGIRSQCMHYLNRCRELIKIVKNEREKQ